MRKDSCKNCKKEFKLSPSKDRGQEFCSLECKKVFNLHPTVVCKACSVEFQVPPSRLRRGASYCSRLCMKKHYKPAWTKESREKLSKTNAGRVSSIRGKSLPQRQGANCHFWKGGVSEKNRTERQNFCSTAEYREFRRKVFERDNYTCVLCERTSKKGDRVCIQLHHIRPFLTHPEERMDFDNVQTLCRKCHYKTDTFGAKVLNKKIICSNDTRNY